MDIFQQSSAATSGRRTEEAGLELTNKKCSTMKDNEGLSHVANPNRPTSFKIGPIRVPRFKTFLFPALSLLAHIPQL